ncbi:Histone-binding protein RBBP4-B [Dissostichus eleginoides]|uniref:Histone-binding protein RBBP4-B n=1 Tax=Dissostichus eleginoides TaxID=100907 RepID=A0AAD9B6A7_DISEL|nr:Histone-binding protein RBBP4-B [Dissostichus eleginoides]
MRKTFINIQKNTNHIVRAAKLSEKHPPPPSPRGHGHPDLRLSDEQTEAWVLTGAPDPAGTEKTPTLLLPPLFIPCQAQTQIRDYNTLVKPAGHKAYVSLPSTCIRVLVFPVMHVRSRFCSTEHV